MKYFFPDRGETKDDALSYKDRPDYPFKDIDVGDPSYSDCEDTATDVARHEYYSGRYPSHTDEPRVITIGVVDADVVKYFVVEVRMIPSFFPMEIK